MSTRFPNPRAARLIACILLGVTASSSAAGLQDTPPSPAGAPVAELAKPTVLLLSNGHVFQGEILEDATGYYLKHKIGVKQFARRNVAGVFVSMADAYQFQLQRLPKNDPDEHMKLALWCMEHHLRDQAKEQLQAVVALSESPRAKAMLFQLESKPAGSLDPNVIVTGGPAMGAERPSDEPRQLNQTILEQLRTQKAPAGAPLILGLPAPLAVKRYQEFGRYVHVQLQNHCARCHDAENPQHAGGFQLVRTRTARDLQNEMILRTNLDAALTLVDEAELAQSRLLTAAALTHPPDGRPVLGGPNHPGYRVLQTWVLSLQDASTGETAVVPARDGAVAPTGGFATGRLPAAKAPAIGQGAPLDREVGETVAPPPRLRQGMAGSRDATAPGVPAETSFPDPRMPKTANAGQSRSAPKAEKPAKPGGPEIVEMEDGGQGIRMPDGSILPYVSLKEPPKKDAEKSTPPAPDAKSAATRPAKPKLDAKVLDQYLQGRNQAK